MPRILLIDDDDLFRTMLRQKLTHFGHTVIEARNGQEGLELFAHADADLVITDLLMPEKEGLEVLMALRKAQPSLKIIAMSGGGRVSATGYLHIAKEMGANRVLAKPFSTDELAITLNDLLGVAPLRDLP